MVTKKNFLKYLKHKKFASGREFSETFGITRQAVNKHLKILIENGKVRKEGATKGTVYSLYGVTDKREIPQKFKKRYTLEGLEVHTVFNEIDAGLQLKKNLSGNVFDIIRYAFTEIMSNAIEHSESKFADVEFVLHTYNCDFMVKDYGIGIFQSLSNKLNLRDETTAVGELLKGGGIRTREKNAGVSISFISKSGDHITFLSHRSELVFDNKAKDVFMSARRFAKGTEARFRISKNSKRKLSNIFSLYPTTDYEHRFEKTRVFVKLHRKDPASRSEARRMLNGLDKCKEVVIDFLGVTSIGQGFADQIFRVFRTAYPDISIRVENLNPALRPIIDNVTEKQKE